MPKKKKAEIPIEELEKKGFIGELEDIQVNGESIFEEAKTSFDVYNADGVYVRTYSVEIHGENAEALANEFAAHTGGIVK